MVYNVQKIIVGALPLALIIIGLAYIAGYTHLETSLYQGASFVLVSWITGHVMTVWTNYFRSIKHCRGKHGS